MTRLEPVSNTETWQDTLEFIEDTDGSAYFTTASPPSDVTLKVRDPDSGQIVLSGSLADGTLVVIDDGEIQFTFSTSQMGSLAPKDYEVGVLSTIDSVTKQAILGTIAILKGL